MLSRSGSRIRFFGQNFTFVDRDKRPVPGHVDDGLGSAGVERQGKWCVRLHFSCFVKNHSVFWDSENLWCLETKQGTFPVLFPVVFKHQKRGKDARLFFLNRRASLLLCVRNVYCNLKINVFV